VAPLYYFWSWYKKSASSRSPNLPDGILGDVVQFYSQVGQDRFLFENFFCGKRDGIFVDIGAYDGEKFNNTLFFERFMGWRGLCVEPLPSAFAKLVARRKAICQQVCVTDFVGEDEFTEAITTIAEGMLSGLTRHFDPRHIQRLQSVAASTVAHKMPTCRILLDRYARLRV
jgi:hypothetical protein